MGVFQAEQLALCGQLYRRSHRRRQPATIPEFFSKLFLVSGKLHSAEKRKREAFGSF